MNSRFEAQRARQYRAIALFFTFLFHIALIGGIYYYSVHDSDTEKNKSEQTVQSKDNIPAKPVSNESQRSLRP